VVEEATTLRAEACLCAEDFLWKEHVGLSMCALTPDHFNGLSWVHHKLFAVANATEISTKVWVLHSAPPSQFPIQPPSKRFRHQGHHVHHVLIRSG